MNRTKYSTPIHCDSVDFFNRQLQTFVCCNLRVFSCTQWWSSTTLLPNIQTPWWSQYLDFFLLKTDELKMGSVGKHHSALHHHFWGLTRFTWMFCPIMYNCNMKSRRDQYVLFRVTSHIFWHVYPHLACRIFLYQVLTLFMRTSVLSYISRI